MLETKPRCKHYKPKEIGYKENCANCYRWIGIRCENHSALTEDWQTRRSDAIDILMRTNKAVWIG